MKKAGPLAQQTDRGAASWRGIPGQNRAQPPPGRPHFPARRIGNAGRLSRFQSLPHGWGAGGGVPSAPNFHLSYRREPFGFSAGYAASLKPTANTAANVNVFNQRDSSRYRFKVTGAYTRSLPRAV